MQGVTAVTAEKCARSSGKAKAVGEASPAWGPEVIIYTGTWAPCLKPLLLLSPDSRPGLGVLWATFYRSKVHRDVATLCDKARGFPILHFSVTPGLGRARQTAGLYSMFQRQ